MTILIYLFSFLWYDSFFLIVNMILSLVLRKQYWITAESTMRGTSETDGEMRMRTYVPFWLLATFSCRVLVAPDGGK